MRRLAVPPALALLALTACGGAPDPVTLQPSAVADCQDTASCSRFDPDVPVLRMSSVCYGACAYVTPLGLPDVVLYGDGRVVRSTHALPDPRPVLTTGQVPPGRVAELAVQARAAGLTGGQRTTLGFTGISVADGGGDVLTAVLDGQQTTVESPQAYDASLDGSSSDPARRAALRTLGEALRGLAADTPYDDDRVVLRADPSPYQDSDAAAWTGPQLTGLPNDSSGRCNIVTGEAARVTLSAVSQDAFPTVHQEGDREFLVEARPALPHEQTCPDVAESVRLVASGQSPG